MSHNLHNNLGNWCIFPENKLIYQGKWLQGPPPPFSGNARKKSIFLLGGCPYVGTFLFAFLHFFARSISFSF